MAYWRQRGEIFCDCGFVAHKSTEFLHSFFCPKVCPKCGDTKGKYYGQWKSRVWTERRTFVGKWYLPWTWGREYIEVKDEYIDTVK